MSLTPERVAVLIEAIGVNKIVDVSVLVLPVTFFSYSL